MRLPKILFSLVMIGTVHVRVSGQPAGGGAFLNDLAAYLDSLSSAGRFSGVVAVGMKGEPVFLRAFGEADRERKLRMTGETALNLGSINKHFTRIAVGQLAAAGKLHPDSTLSSAWPEYPNPAVGRRVTVRQILEHRSGIAGNIFAAPPGGNRHDLRHNRDVFHMIAGESLEFEPGTRRRYSNAGFVVLGELIARVSGEDYYDYVRRHIYEPAGMTRTAHYAADSLPPWAAVGYTREAGGPPGVAVTNTPTLPGRGSAAGGGYSTAGDLLRFLQAVRENRIPGAVSPGIGIAGGAPGLNAAIEGDLPGGYDLVVLSNLDPPSAEGVAARVRALTGAED